jgi:hypothetical protein
VLGFALNDAVGAAGGGGGGGGGASTFFLPQELRNIMAAITRTSAAHFILLVFNSPSQVQNSLQKCGNNYSA